MIVRTLWNSQTVPALGLGCWAIGGPFYHGDQPLGWGNVDDAQSIRAIHAAYAGGIRFFDTSDAYGTGHSEEILGKALAGRDDVVIATKFGNTYNRQTKNLTGTNTSPEYINQALTASLNRLGRDHIDLYQLHIDRLGDDAEVVHETLLDLVDTEKIGAFGWSTDSLEQAKRWPTSRHYAAVQHACNLFSPAQDLIEFCAASKSLSINRSPLAMGLLTKKFDHEHSLSRDDIRRHPPEWLPYFDNGKPSASFAQRLDAVRELLMTGGRTLTQGALGWIWSGNDVTLPIPGFRTEHQVEENLNALDHGPLDPAVKIEIDRILRDNT